MFDQANNRIIRITSAISVSSNENENRHNLNDPKPFLHPPDSKDIFLLPNAGIYYTVEELRIARETLRKNHWKK